MGVNLIDYKGILLDLDDTLYAYEPAHNNAMNRVYAKLNNIGIDCDKNVFERTFFTARKAIHRELDTLASSHNRLLYFQRVLELLHVNPLSYALDLYDCYWDAFLEAMTVSSELKRFLQAIKTTKVCLITDLTAQIQFRKCRKLGLDAYVNAMVTSEEAGKEKPHPYPFLLALKKLNLQASNVLMIGDSFTKDIVGATSLGIHSLWLNKKGRREDLSNLVQEFRSLDEITNKLLGESSC